MWLSEIEEQTANDSQNNSFDKEQLSGTLHLSQWKKFPTPTFEKLRFLSLILKIKNKLKASNRYLPHRWYFLQQQRK